MRYLLFSIVLFLANTASAQRTDGSFIEIEIKKGNSNSTCSDKNGDLDNHWGVNIAGNGYKYYVPTGSCRLYTPNLHYVKFFPNGNPTPESIEICFRAMDFKSSSYCCDVIGDCIETICEIFPVPTEMYYNKFHTLELPVGGESEGGIEFSIRGGKRSSVEEPCGNQYSARSMVNSDRDFFESNINFRFTPNGDGVYDELTFDLLTSSPDKYPNNRIFIYNDQGDTILRAAPYTNNWNAQNDCGQNLPEGTYYYVLELDAANSIYYNGTITILR